MAFFISRAKTGDSLQISLSFLLGILAIFIYYISQSKIEESVNYLITKLFSKNKIEYLSSFKIPSVVIYRIRKNYNVENEEVDKASNELIQFFTAYQKFKLNHTDSLPDSKTLSPLSYAIWKEFSLSHNIYYNFCFDAFGNYLTFDTKNIKDSEIAYAKTEPHLKSKHILT